MICFKKQLQLKFIRHMICFKKQLQLKLIRHMICFNKQLQLKRLEQEQTASTSSFIRSGFKKSSLLHAFHLCRLQENELVEHKSS